MTAGFFTRPAKRFEVPHARVGVRFLLLIHACIGKAFVLLRGRGEPLGQASENAITNALESVLCNDLLLDPVYFRGVTRGSEVENFDGRKIGKKPDLVFHLRRPNELWDQRQDAVFAECKLIGKKHSLAKQYCAVGTSSGGIERFLVGDYAWAMQEALMIGYVRDGFAVVPHLAKALSDAAKRGRLGQPTQPEVVGTSRAGQPVLYRTRHTRGFQWRSGAAATPVDVYHSWHVCE